MPSLTESELKVLGELFQRTTPGEWISFVEGRDHESGSDFIRTGTESDIELSGVTHADQDFIAMAHTLMPKILEDLRTSAINSTD